MGYDGIHKYQKRRPRGKRQSSGLLSVLIISERKYLVALIADS
jgi:hypothetical protein